jgi:hypothetical protein
MYDNSLVEFDREGRFMPGENFTVIVPQLLLITGFLLLNKFRLHDWMGHYGTETHLKFKLTEVLPITSAISEVSFLHPLSRLFNRDENFQCGGQNDRAGNPYRDCGVAARAIFSFLQKTFGANKGSRMVLDSFFRGASSRVNTVHGHPAERRKRSLWLPGFHVFLDDDGDASLFLSQKNICTLLRNTPWHFHFPAGKNNHLVGGFNPHLLFTPQ